MTELEAWQQPCHIAGLTFTDLCNQFCGHCHNDSRVKVTKPQLTIREWERVAEQLKEIGVEFISFGGGESLIHPEFVDFCEMLRERGFRMGLITNGTVPDPERLPWELFETVSVSIEFPDSEAQDRFRGVKGAFRAARDTLELLRERNVERELFTALMAVNLPELPRMYELAESHEVDYWKVIRFRLQGRGTRRRMQFGLSPQAYRAALEFLSSTGRPLVISDPIFALLKKAGYYRQGCTCGTSSIRIEADGTITPCTFAAGYKLGNVKTDSLVDVWRKSKGLAPIRWREPPDECRGCAAWEHCRGGCFGSAFLATGRIDRRDPQCWLKNPGADACLNADASRVAGGADMRSFVCSAYLAVNGAVSRYPLSLASE